MQYDSRKQKKPKNKNIFFLANAVTDSRNLLTMYLCDHQMLLCLVNVYVIKLHHSKSFQAIKVFQIFSFYDYIVVELWSISSDDRWINNITKLKNKTKTKNKIWFACINKIPQLQVIHSMYVCINAENMVIHLLSLQRPQSLVIISKKKNTYFSS